MVIVLRGSRSPRGSRVLEGRKESSVLITYCMNLDYKEKTVKRARALLKDKIEAVKEGRSWYVQLRDPVDPL